MGTRLLILSGKVFDSLFASGPILSGTGAFEVLEGLCWRDMNCRGVKKFWQAVQQLTLTQGW